MLVAIDVDGTLVGEALTISEADATAIHAAVGRGDVVCLASGRLLAASRPFADQLGLDGPIIVLQGAVAYDLRSGSRLFFSPLAVEVALRAYDALRAQNFHLQLYYGDHLYLDAMNRWARYYIGLSRVEPVMVADLRALLVQAPPPEPGPVKLLAIAEPAAVDAAAPQLRAQLGNRANVMTSLPPFLEVTDPAANKGEALHRMAVHLGISMNDTAAIGDADNDIPMFLAAAQSFAVDNGTVAAKAAAKRVVPTLGRGVAAALQILKEERAREPA